MELGSDNIGIFILFPRMVMLGNNHPISTSSSIYLFFYIMDRGADNGFISVAIVNLVCQQSFNVVLILQRGNSVYWCGNKCGNSKVWCDVNT